MVLGDKVSQVIDSADASSFFGSESAYSYRIGRVCLGCSSLEQINIP
jgi:hypothetical protein